jgi:hypothetical protein
MKGLSSNGGKFKEYSREPMYIAYKGARLKPKGGTRVSRTGASIYYAGGYQQYKHDSRKRQGGQGKTAEVDLVLSGQLMNNLVVLEATNTRFRIGLTDNEINILVNAVAFDISKKLGRKV